MTFKSLKRVLIGTIIGSLIVGIVPVLAEAELYTNYVVDFETADQKDKEIPLVYGGWSPGGKMVTEYADGAGIDGSTAFKLSVTANNKEAINLVTIATRRNFYAKARRGDTIEVNVFIPEGSKIRFLNLYTKTADGHPEAQQSAKPIEVKDGFLETNKWYSISMTINDTVAWPSGEFNIQVNYQGDMSVLVDNLSIKSTTQGLKYEPYVGLKSDTFRNMTSMQIAKEMVPGWNYGNVFDMANEGQWNNLPAKQEIFPFLKKEGINSVRLPTSWGGHTGPGPEYKIELEWLDRMERITDWCLSADLYAMLNTHHDSGWIGKGLQSSDAKEVTHTIDRLCAIWAQIAERFKWKNEKLIFEVMNEVTSTPEIIARTNQAVLDTIRKSGGYNATREVNVGGPGYGYTLAQVLPDDPHIMYHYHDYGAWSPVMTTSWGTPAERASVDKMIQDAYDVYIKKGIPVIVGEYGYYKKFSQVNYKWYEHMLGRAYEASDGYVPMLWDNGAGEGYLNFDTLKWRDPKVIQIILNACKGIKNSFVDESFFFVKVGDEERNAKLNLYLNGNKLKSIKYGLTTLKEGINYKVDKSGKEVTIMGNTIKKMVRGEGLGVKTNLIFSFTGGLEDTIPVVRYTNPVADQTEVTVNPKTVSKDLVIPIESNGLQSVKSACRKQNGGGPVFSSWSVNEGVQAKIKNEKIVIPRSELMKLTEDVEYTITFFPENMEIKLKVKVTED